jgi:hypothetical protein
VIQVIEVPLDNPSAANELPVQPAISYPGDPDGRYTGGVDVIDFSKPTRLKEIAYYDIAGLGPQGSDNWSAYPYTGPLLQGGPGIPVYASDGVHTPDSAKGMVVFRTIIEKPSKGAIVAHLNPRTMD